MSNKYVENASLVKKKKKLLSIFKDVGSLVMENEVLEGKTMCKICGERQVKLVFMPCAHLVCCLECGQYTTHCPVRVRIYHILIFI